MKYIEIYNIVNQFNVSFKYKYVVLKYMKHPEHVLSSNHIL